MAAIATTTLASPASALVVNFYNGANLYATMTTSGGTNFDLHLIGTGSAGAYVSELFMDGPNGTFTDNSTATSIVAEYSLNHYNAGEGTKVFDWKLDFPNANNATRLTANEHALWSIVVTDPTDWDFNKLHINAFDGTNSIKLNGCIAGAPDCGGGGNSAGGGGGAGNAPEPGTIALTSVALLGMGLIRRRRHR